MAFANSFFSTTPVERSPCRITAELTALVEADEELIRTAQVATREADRSNREVDRWRLEASLQSKRVDDMRREKALLQKELDDLDRRIEKERNRKERAVHQAPLNRQVKADRYEEDDDLAVIPGAFSHVHHGETTSPDNDLHYLVSRAIASLDAAQAEVSSLRRQHADLWHSTRQAQDDVVRLRAAYGRMTQREEELLQQQFLLRAAEADPASRRAAESQRDAESLFAQLAERRVALRQCQAERATMVAHLVEGAKKRRRQARRVQGIVSRQKWAEGHGMLLSLQEENDRLHERYEQLVRDGEEEGVVLVDYLDVLQERLIVLLQAKSESPGKTLLASPPKQF